MSFRAMLKKRQVATNSLLCVGLDPKIAAIPARFRQMCVSDSAAVFAWMMWIVNETVPFGSMFKLQRAYYEALEGGEDMLRMLVTFIRLHHPDIPVFIDCKRGDIDRTQAQYRRAHLELDGGHAMNYTSWMGVEDTLGSLVSTTRPGRGLVGLGRTSNPRAWTVQDAILADGRTNWEMVVEEILRCSRQFNVAADAGVVMGAAYIDPNDATAACSQHLVKCRKIVGNDLWFLIPGVGKQGGLIKQTVEASFLGAGSISINSSSGITEAEHPAGAAEKTRDEMRAASGVLA